MLTGLRSLQSMWRRAPRPCRQPKGGEDSVLNTDTGKGAGRVSKICFHFRDHGNCPKGDKCEYSHDKDCVRKLFVLAETVLGPRLTVVARAVRGEAVEKETAKAEIAVLTGEETEAKDEETSKVFCVPTS